MCGGPKLIVKVKWKTRKGWWNTGQKHSGQMKNTFSSLVSNTSDKAGAVTFTGDGGDAKIVPAVGQSGHANPAMTLYDPLLGRCNLIWGSLDGMDQWGLSNYQRARLSPKHIIARESSVLTLLCSFEASSIILSSWPIFFLQGNGIHRKHKFSGLFDIKQWQEIRLLFS